MKIFLVILTLLILAQVASADEFIVMTNGMTCWRNSSGFVYGCSGGVSTGDSGFNDSRTGTRYEYINPNQAIDTRRGQPINVPRRQWRNDDSDE